MKYGLVFAGGGAKGSYEIGVWRALKQMNFDIGAVTGVSIGSVNGAMFVQDNLDVAQKMWENIRLSDIVKIDGDNSSNLFSVQNIVPLATEMYKNQGLDVSGLELILKDIINEDKIRKSDIEFGLSTYSLTDKKEVELFKSDIPQGKLVEYLMASACLPVFKKRIIDGREFIDGAVNNNMPVNMLLNKGYKNIIAVDVGGIGVVKTVNDFGANIINIKCTDNIIGTMEFEPDTIRKSIKKGYYDCYKAFGRLCGDKFYFNTMSYYRAKNKYSDEMLANLEFAGDAFGLEKNTAYNVEDFEKKILESYKAAYSIYKSSVTDIQGFFDFVLKNKIDDCVTTVWVVDLILNNVDFMNNKIIMNLLGTVVNAASAVVYLLQNKAAM